MMRPQMAVDLSTITSVDTEPGELPRAMAAWVIREERYGEPLDAFRLEEIEVPASCVHAGESIRGLRVRDRTGAMIIALRKRDGTFDSTPSPDALLEAGDVLIGVGTDEELRALEELFAPAETPVAG
jgi:K+/H+ antiporter YhaU regulatory subunit KhtT